MAQATKAKFLEAGPFRWALVLPALLVVKRMGRPEVAVETVAVAVAS